MLIDGQAHFGCSLAALPDHPLSTLGITARRITRSRGFDLPLLDMVVPIDPLPVWVQQGVLVVSCPSCAGTPQEELQFVWRGGPYLMFCLVCGNAAVGKLWRPVALPDDLDAIDAALACRPIGNRTWTPDQTIADLAAENVRFEWAPPETEVA